MHSVQYDPRYPYAPQPGMRQAGPRGGGDDAAAIVTRIGTVVGGGVIAAIAASLPAALRLASPSHAFEVWTVLAGLLTPLAILAVGVLRRARVGLKELAGDGIAVFAAGALWWIVLELGLLSVFGAMLRANTHHRGLAGVTFAIFALLSGVVTALIAARGVRMLATMSAQAQRVAAGVAAGAAFFAIILVGARTANAEGLHTASALVDVLSLTIAATAVSLPALARVRPLAIAGVPIALVLVALGLTMERATPEIRAAVAETAPLHGWMLGLLEPSKDQPAEQEKEPVRQAVPAGAH